MTAVTLWYDVGMRHIRFAGIALAVVAVGAAACSSQQTASHQSARVTVDGTTQTVNAFKCSQRQQYWTFDIGTDQSGLEAVVTLRGDNVNPQWVKIRNIGGFTGSFWQGGVGSAEAGFHRDAFTITGTAYGMDNQNRNKPTTTNFNIVANC